MSGKTMTMLGATAAVLAFIMANMPKDTPQYVTLIVGALNAGLIYYLGLTNQGTDKPPQLTVNVRAADSQSEPPTIIKP